MARRATTTTRKARPPRRRAEEPTGPHGRLGLAWAAVTLAAAAGPRPVLAVWLAPQAALAALQLARVTHRQGRAALPLPAAAGAAAACLAAAVGLWAVTAVIAATTATAAAWPGPPRRGKARRRARPPATGRALDTFTVATLAGMAAGSLVLVRGRGFTEVAVLVVLAGAYDAGAYLVGTGAATRWEGPIAGIAAVGAVDLCVAAVLVPPFRGASPWVAGAAVAVGAPLGTALARSLSAGPATRLSALRRLDAFLVAGPAYAAVVAVAL